MKIILIISRVFAGLVFIFSGFVKAIDPTGFAIKFEEYFLAFHIDFLVVLAMPLAIMASAAELMIGINLLFRLRMKFTAWLLLMFMVFFTLLTFILALTNPVSDCGCFGDAIKLTNWQTFGKNIILLIPALLIFVYRKRYNPVSSVFTEWYLTGVNFLIPVFISVFCLFHQPVIDFRPYKTGSSIPEKMTLPEDARVDQFETILVYRKGELVKEFNETDFPWQDTAWKWVETRQKLISRGDEPPIHDFSITTAQGDDITEKILSDSGFVFLIVAPKLEKASEKGMLMMNNLASKALSLHFKVYCLTSSVSDATREFMDTFQPVFEICSADETTLKTISRANPGLMILQQGTILGKWNFRDAPKSEDLSENLLPVLISRQNKSIEGFSVVLIGCIILIFYLSFFMFYIRK